MNNQDLNKYLYQKGAGGSRGPVPPTPLGGKQKDYASFWGSTKIINRSKKQAPPKHSSNRRQFIGGRSPKEAAGYEPEPDEDNQPLLHKSKIVKKNDKKRHQSNELDAGNDPI